MSVRVRVRACKCVCVFIRWFIGFYSNIVFIVCFAYMVLWLSAFGSGGSYSDYLCVCLCGVCVFVCVCVQYLHVHARPITFSLIYFYTLFYFLLRR